MHDAGVRRDDLEAVECLLAPLEECIAFLVTPELKLRIEREGVVRAEMIDLHRMVDDQLGGLERIDLARVAAERLHRIAHCREVDDCRHAGEVLHQHARRAVLNLLGGLGLGIPVG